MKGYSEGYLGATGFDVGCETPGACRGAGYLVNLLANQ